MTFRLRLKSGMEIIVVQGKFKLILEQDFYLITIQLCKAPTDVAQTGKEEEKKNI